MSASNEWQEWHLTPNGWVEGSTKLDHYPKPKVVEPPVDRVLTICTHEYWGSAFGPPHRWTNEEFRSPDEKLVQQLMEKYGSVKGSLV